MSNDGILTFADGLVQLGNLTLPGILVQQSIRNAVRYDQSKQDQMSGKNKVALGWEDATITLTVDLLTETGSDCYQKLTEINRIFKGAGKKKATPTIYTVTNRHVRARGISRVVFDALDSFETDGDDVIQATLTFVEHLPPVIRREKQAIARKKAAGSTTTAPTVKATPAVAPKVTKDTTNPLIAGFNEGNN